MLGSVSTADLEFTRSVVVLPDGAACRCRRRSMPRSRVSSGVCPPLEGEKVSEGEKSIRTNESAITVPDAFPSPFPYAFPCLVFLPSRKRGTQTIAGSWVCQSASVISSWPVPPRACVPRPMSSRGGGSAVGRLPGCRPTGRAAQSGRPIRPRSAWSSRGVSCAYGRLP